ncbi:MAG: hypothetical protein M1819_003800 [Sarea resinae]|nr:MAG: hypothetical protein M1819_003800 [Sarea resinae]
MAQQDSQTPNLASILQVLAQHSAPHVLEQPGGHNLTAATEDVADPDVGEDNYEPPDFILSEHLQQHGTFPPGTSTPTPSTSESQEFRSRPIESTNIIHKPPTIDASSIIDWSAGVRCVMKTVARSEAIQARIRKMIQVQIQHERQWWDGRQALLQKQEARVEGKKKLDEVLRSVGGNVPSSGAVSSPEDDAAELKRYDMKVYIASREMVKAMTLELKNVGVPFFGTDPALVSKGGADPVRGGLHEATGESDGGQAGERIDDAELLKLQKRMLDLLEDMCKE